MRPGSMKVGGLGGEAAGSISSPLLLLTAAAVSGMTRGLSGYTKDQSKWLERSVPIDRTGADAQKGGRDTHLEAKLSRTSPSLLHEGGLERVSRKPLDVEHRYRRRWRGRWRGRRGRKGRGRKGEEGGSAASGDVEARQVRSLSWEEHGRALLDKEL
jgi:hypothetical protein